MDLTLIPRTLSRILAQIDEAEVSSFTLLFTVMKKRKGCDMRTTRMKNRQVTIIAESLKSLSIFSCELL